MNFNVKRKQHFQVDSRVNCIVELHMRCITNDLNNEFYMYVYYGWAAIWYFLAAASSSLWIMCTFMQLTVIYYKILTVFIEAFINLFKQQFIYISTLSDNTFIKWLILWEIFAHLTLPIVHINITCFFFTWCNLKKLVFVQRGWSV